MLKQNKKLFLIIERGYLGKQVRKVIVSLFYLNNLISN